MSATPAEHTDLLPAVPPSAPAPSSLAELRRVGHHRVVRAAQGPRPGLADHAGRRHHRADRPVGLREVDVPADPQPDARAGALGRAGRRGAARRRGHLRPGQEAHRRAARDRDGLPEAEPVPGHVDPRERARRPQAHRHPRLPVGEGGPGRVLPDQGRALARGAGPPRRPRRRPLRWPAAAALHRALARRTSRGCC